MPFRFETANERWRWYKRVAAGEFGFGPQDSEGYFSQEEIGASLENIYQEAQNDFNVIRQQIFNNHKLMAGNKSDDLDLVLMRSDDLEEELKEEGDVKKALFSLNWQMERDPQWSAAYNNQPYTIENSTIQPKHWLEIVNIVMPNAEHLKSIIDNWLPPQEQMVWWPQSFSATAISAHDARYEFLDALSLVIDFCEKAVENGGVPETINGLSPQNFFQYISNLQGIMRVFPAINTEWNIVGEDENGSGEANVV